MTVIEAMLCNPGKARVLSTGTAFSLISVMTWSAPADLAMPGAHQVLQARQSSMCKRSPDKLDEPLGEVQISHVEGQCMARVVLHLSG